MTSEHAPEEFSNGGLDEKFEDLVGPIVREREANFVKGAKTLFLRNRKAFRYAQGQVDPLKHQIIDALDDLGITRDDLAFAITITKGRASTPESFAQTLAEIHLQRELRQKRDREARR